MNKTRTFLNLGYITKVNIDNLNSSENPGNLVLLKKVQNVVGDYYVYISGQAFRYYLKTTLMQLGMPLTKIDKSGEIDIKDAPTGDKIKRYEWILKNNPDIDLFGFMEAGKGSQQAALRRWSPTKVSPLISIYPWKGENDLLTRKKEGQEGGDFVKVEVNTFNFMRGTSVINVDEVGAYVDELNLEIRDVIGGDERYKRISMLLDAFKNLNGGGKIARLLDDLTPKFLIIVNQTAGTPIFLNSLNVNENEELDVGLISETLNEYQDIIRDYVIGIRSNILKNEEEIKKEFDDNVKGIKEAIDEAKTWIKNSG